MQTAEEIYEIGCELYKIGDRIGANSKYEQVCLLKPDHAKAYAQRGVIAFEQGRFFDAMMNYMQSIKIQPAPECLNNLGTAFIELNQNDKAERAFRAAVATRPTLHTAWNNLGRLLLITGRLDQARNAFCQAIHVKEDYIDAHMGLAFAALEQGAFTTGWAEYEWRRKYIPERHEMLTEWNGEKLGDDEGILLLSEQGIGDTIQFCRYAPLLKAAYGGKVYIEARPSCIRFLQTLLGIDGVIAYGDAVPSNVKYKTMLMSCPLKFGHFSVEQIPSSHAYLAASPGMVDLFRSYVDVLPADSIKVGICWAGNNELKSTDRRRSTNLEWWKPLADVPGISWISLQKGPPADQLYTAQTGMLAIDLMKKCDDIADTAALIMHCDLVITVDTSVAHIAAALGKTVWVLSRFDACWRWLGYRTDSPWYPTVRHYRQKKFNDWHGLLAEVADDLKRVSNEFREMLRKAQCQE